MSSQVVVYLGPARSGKTHELLRRYGEVLARRPPRFGESLWLAPTAREAAKVRELLIAAGVGGCFNPGVMTFDDFASRVALAYPSRLRRIDVTMQRALLRRLIQSALDRGELDFYAEAARRTGFADLVLDHIRELKRRDVLPLEFSRASAPLHDARQQQELAQLYADYQQQLTTHSLVDVESSYWAARDALAKQTCTAFANLELVVVDGFTDFTNTQHEILAQLANQTKHLVIALQDDAREPSPGPLPKGPSPCPLPEGEGNRRRADLFAKTTVTLETLRRHVPRLAERRFAPRQSGSLAYDYVLRHVFCTPGSAPALPAEAIDSVQQFEFIAAASAQDEIVQIARRIKRLLDEQAVSPADILVVFRSLGDSAARVREVFGQFGIPYFLESSERLATTAICKTLQALVRLDREDWPFRAVVSIVTNRALTALDDTARQAADWLVRDLQIAQGRGELFDRVEQLAGTDPAQNKLNGKAQRRVNRAKKALPALVQLALALDELPHEATPVEWSTALAQLATSLGLLRTGCCSDPSNAHLSPESPRADSADELAWRRIEEHLGSLQRLDTWLGQSPRHYSRGDVLTVLTDIAKHEVLPQQHGDAGRVRVLTAPGARTVTAKHVFLAGMSEQAFPAPERAGRLCSEDEYRSVSRATDQPGRGKPAPFTASRPQEEMLLFYGVLACAEGSLTISYPALDDKAQELPPSPYVTEILRTLGPQAQSYVRLSGPQLSPVPAGEPCSSVDWRVQAVGRALNSDVRLLAGLFHCDTTTTKMTGEAIDAGLRIVHARSRREAYGPAEGLLLSPAAAGRLAERFGPRHLWSPSQWETYAACPYKFFLEHVLGLEPLGDLELETDYGRRGSRLHDVLAEFHRRWQASRDTRPLSAEQEAAQFVEHLKNVVDERLVTSQSGIEAALVELDRRQILKWAQRHFEHHARYQAQWSKLDAELEAAHFELRFGPARSNEADDDPHSCDDAFMLTINGEPVHVAGRIDRIDVARIGERVVFNVIDYKSGRKPSLKEEHVLSGEHLQLPIYVAAAQALLFGGDAEPLAAGYWTMGGGFDAKGVLAVQHDETDKGKTWKKTWATVEELIGQFIGAIRRGEYPVFSRDDQCTSRCDFNTMCHIAQIRSLGKTWQAACGLATTDKNSAPSGDLPGRD